MQKPYTVTLLINFKIYNTMPQMHVHESEIKMYTLEKTHKKISTDIPTHTDTHIHINTQIRMHAVWSSPQLPSL